MFYQEVFANDVYTYTANIALANNVTWTVNSHCVNLDFNAITILQSNTIIDIGWLTANIAPIVSSTPNTINYTYSLTANSFQTSNFMTNSVDPAERVIIIQTKFTSNLGSTFNAKNVYLRVKNNSFL